MRRPQHPARGFTLIEILVAFAIFSFLVMAAWQTMANSNYLADAAWRARDLRMLAERRLGEALVHQEYYDDILSGDFSDWPEYGERFRDWEWELDVQDVVVFGTSSDPEARYLNGKPPEEEQATQGGGGPGGQGGAKPRAEEKLRELTLRVTAPSEEGDADAVEIVTYMPLVERKAKAGR